MHFFKLPLILLLLIYSPVMGQTDQTNDVEKISEVVMTLFKGMKASDGDLIKSVITGEATLQTVTGQNGEAVLRTTNMDQFVESVRTAEPGMLIEEILDISVRVDGDLAAAWMDYRFYRGEEFSHCGVNSMNLIRKNDGWKIFSIVDTRRQEGCE